MTEGRNMSPPTGKISIFILHKVGPKDIETMKQYLVLLEGAHITEYRTMYGNDHGCLVDPNGIGRPANHKQIKAIYKLPEVKS
jgi:hypothetical protein